MNAKTPSRRLIIVTLFFLALFISFLTILLNRQQLILAASIDDIRSHTILRYLWKPFHPRFQNGSRQDMDALLQQYKSIYDVISWGNSNMLYGQLDTFGLDFFEEGIAYLYDAQQNGAGSFKTLLNIHPRFAGTEGISDRLSDGQTIIHDGTKCPNYGIIDIYDPVQKNKYFDYIKKVLTRFGNDPRLIGFNLLWGMGEENTFFTATSNMYCDIAVSSSPYKDTASGYSALALTNFKAWLVSLGLNSLAEGVNPQDQTTWPLPRRGVSQQSLLYIRWLEFRSMSVGKFQEDMFAFARQYTTKPLNTFHYLTTEPYITSMSPTIIGTTDANISQFGIGMKNYLKAILDTDFISTAIVGSLPASLNTQSASALKASVPWPWYKVEMIREIAKGAFPMAFWRPEYRDSGLFASLSQFYKDSYPGIRDSINRKTPTVALLVPSWSFGFLNIPTGNPLFLPVPQSSDTSLYDVLYYQNKLEELGINYDLIQENEILNKKISSYKAVIIPYSNHIRYAFESARWDQVATPNMILLTAEPYQPQQRLTKEQFKAALVEKGVTDINILSVDTPEAPRATVGMVNNVLFNFTGAPRSVTVCSSNPQQKTLAAYEYQVVNCTSAIPGDLNRDGKVDIFDYNLIVAEFGKTGMLVSDINGDGKVDIFDYNTLVTNFGK